MCIARIITYLKFGIKGENTKQILAPSKLSLLVKSIQIYIHYLSIKATPTLLVTVVTFVKVCVAHWTVHPVILTVSWPRTVPVDTELHLVTVTAARIYGSEHEIVRTLSATASVKRMASIRDARNHYDTTANHRLGYWIRYRIRNGNQFGFPRYGNRHRYFHDFGRTRCCRWCCWIVVICSWRWSSSRWFIWWRVASWASNCYVVNITVGNVDWDKYTILIIYVIIYVYCRRYIVIVVICITNLCVWRFWLSLIIINNMLFYHFLCTTIVFALVCTCWISTLNLTFVATVCDLWATAGCGLAAVCCLTAVCCLATVCFLAAICIAAVCWLLATVSFTAKCTSV